MTFATDIDLLHWEPNILHDAAAVAQTIITGTGTLAGTTFTIDDGSLTDSEVSDEHAVVLDAPIDGTYPVADVTSDTTVTLSILYDQLQTSPVLNRSGSDVGFAIRTFWPQRVVVSELLLQAAGVKESSSASILNPEALRRACTLGALQLIYVALAAAAAEPASLLIRAELYERLYRRALRSAAVDIDTDGDGIADVRRHLGVLELHRA